MTNDEFAGTSPPGATWFVAAREGPTSFFAGALPGRRASARTTPNASNGTRCTTPSGFVICDANQSSRCDSVRVQRGWHPDAACGSKRAWPSPLCVAGGAIELKGCDHMFGERIRRGKILRVIGGTQHARRSHARRQPLACVRNSESKPSWVNGMAPPMSRRPGPKLFKQLSQPCASMAFRQRATASAGRGVNGFGRCCFLSWAAVCVSTGAAARSSSGLVPGQFRPESVRRPMNAFARTIRRQPDPMTFFSPHKLFPGRAIPPLAKAGRARSELPRVRRFVLLPRPNEVMIAESLCARNVGSGKPTESLSWSDFEKDSVGFGITRSTVSEANGLA